MPRVARRWDSTGLDPRARRIVAALSGAASFAALNVEAARDAYREARAPYLWPPDEVARACALETGGGAPPTRLFRPLARAPSGPPRAYIFLHGGGRTVGDLSTYELLRRRLARVLRADILSVDYRLAPEHPFPAALDDARAGLFQPPQDDLTPALVGRNALAAARARQAQTSPTETAKGERAASAFASHPKLRRSPPAPSRCSPGGNRRILEFLSGIKRIERPSSRAKRNPDLGFAAAA